MTDCQEGPDAIDSRTEERLGIVVEGTYEIAGLLDLVKERIAPSDLRDICGDCRWLERGWCEAALGSYDQSYRPIEPHASLMRQKSR